ncbi:MAG: hypothetical protein AB7E51_07445 [Pseudodesulfovibrio sp.]|jgi:hypothetical protein|uniref:Uncharacterized protein n=1 Tax=Pseudodesulfovibrio indicus TaxID=1716143 RepID=A0A126QPQ1_9BACT|nr:hypothetical protein [Pseudodesulfovibrio indicus]AMK11894.1 hypothetical protein AWY79_12605 [Pseudodesulfovibrio indicus]TDT87158.1 hypothetical protein EDC59_10945 [Pseudodesulfovibrio indicus]
MGQYASFSDNDTLEAQVKTLADDELLDFWEETQQLARMLDQAEQTDLEYNPEYERVILQELQYRTCFKGRS